MTRWLRVSVLALLSAGLPALASAQTPGATASRWLLGGSVGLGNSSPALCDGCKTGLGIGVHGGAMVGPHVALGAEASFLGGAGVDFNPRSRFVMCLSAVALVTGDDDQRLADEPAHKAIVATALVRFGITWRSLS